MINALNSGAKVFMADFEDSLSPTWANIIEGQINLQEAIRRTLEFKSPEGRVYSLNEQSATLVVRPRGWHLSENNLRIDGKPMSGSLFDFGLYFFHNAKELLKRGSGPYFYLPKMESHLEARLWNDVFNFAQEKLQIPRGTIRATVLIETILAAFEMEEILFELREHMAGLNAGRWDYMFSCIKKFRNISRDVFPDRTQVTMTVPFMRAYTELLVKTCHKRGAHAMGGMAAFIPSRKDAKVNEIALSKVREDKMREVQVKAKELIDFQIPDGVVTEGGLRNNISVALQYIESWLRGTGAVAIFNLMEDAATAEISRAELWQWVHRKAKTAEGSTIDGDLYKKIRDEELQKLGGISKGKFRQTTEILDSLVLENDFSEFLTVPAYRHLDQ